MKNRETIFSPESLMHIGKLTMMPGDPKAHHTLLAVALIAAITLAVAVLWTAIVSLRPLPSRTVVMVTGPEGGAAQEFGRRYREVLARQGIDLRLVPTAGSLENLSRLRDPESMVEFGFLQGGITSEKESPGLASLGTVSYEPLWFFYRGVFRGKVLQALRGRRISIGPEGSGTRALALELLRRNGITPDFAEFLPLPPHVAGEKLLLNEIDAALMVTSWDSPIVRRLLADGHIELASFPRTDAYVALYPFLNKLTLPEGVGDLAGNRPPADVVLIAPKSSLVVRRDLHPAIQYLLLDAAAQIHSGPGIFQKAGQFPAQEAIDLPLSEAARQFYKSGRPFLQRHLPFWLAALVDRLLILIIPVVGLIYPLLRFIPAVYVYQLRRRIFRLYNELWSLEHELETREAGQNVDDLVARLNVLENRASRIRVPLHYSSMLHTWRMHIALIHERLKRRAAGAVTS
ncbi:C4-dicarboxylate ABC transporter substrate-binding protein [Geobacter sp. SVR]|nr:C4-dicarboxylate ABC transporter substrate-binding protein [Geobacter sp. SVR]